MFWIIHVDSYFLWWPTDQLQLTKRHDLQMKVQENLITLLVLQNEHRHSVENTKEVQIY